MLAGLTLPASRRLTREFDRDMLAVIRSRTGDPSFSRLQGYDSKALRHTSIPSIETNCPIRNAPQRIS
jgi:hypothetical protein